jgi:hypothetical protein
MVTGSRTTASWPVSLLDQIDALTAQVDALTDRVSELIDQIPAAWGVDAGGVTGPQAAPARTP